MTWDTASLMQPYRNGEDRVVGAVSPCPLHAYGLFTIEHDSFRVGRHRS
jgi:hypothetical protein